ncbi:hypothetical protein L6164_001468 [Bauhinia variegata]|uniref:Uncharacterized protein n=1 Tax=Bauhinia variegata TaxID=167791 RepID=A0ACB9QA82_BAUVA|nr:hypothetical protein L6164_001468 [Bauhinia variegata]
MEDRCHSLIPSNIGANVCENSLAPSDNGANDSGGHNTPMESGHELHSLNENLLIPPPKIGMIFGSEYEVRSYYTKYAGQLGFGIMTRNSRKRRDGKVAYLILSCSKGGNRRRSSKRSPIRNVASKKQTCEAHINVSVCKDGGYQIKTVVLKHNHDMHPNKDNVNFDIRVKRTLDLNDQAGLRMNKSFRSPVVEVGDCDNMTFCDNSCVQKQRKLIGKDGDGDALHKYFVRMQEQNKNFFYAIDMDDCLQVRNVFWADARSIAAYKSFGDVVTVDCTYLTN